MAQQGREGKKPAATPEQTAAQKAKRSRTLRLGLGVVILVLFVVFVVQNSDDAGVDFLWMDFEVPLIYLFVACALIGAGTAFLLARPGRRAERRYTKELERRLGERKS